MSWQEHILKEVSYANNKLVLVSDPDGLLIEEGLSQQICEKGFELITLEDKVAFRYVYESKYRTLWDKGEEINLKVILRTSESDFNNFPYDILQAGKKLFFGIGELFPNLSYPIVSSLSRSDLESLYQAQVLYKPENLSENATKDFILKYVFEIIPEMIKQEVDLLRVLVRKHYRWKNFPEVLNNHITKILTQNSYFKNWPLEKIISEEEEFFTFLQEQWEYFIEKKLPNQTKNKTTAHKFQPLNLPFEHTDVRVYIDTFFLEGLLKPVPVSEQILPQIEVEKIKADAWITVGIQADLELNKLNRLYKLIESIEKSSPSSESKYQDWFTFIHRWAELIVVWYETKTLCPPDIAKRYHKVEENVDNAFFGWIQKKYIGLHNQLANIPIMPHHVSRRMAHYIEESEKNKAALLVLDGMAFDQWILIKETLLQKKPDLKFKEESIFSWIPTITSVSRQSIFAGKPPIFFPESIYSTSREAFLWNQFWMDRGLLQNQILYSKDPSKTSDITSLKEVLSNPKLRVVGLVVDKIDKILHGTVLGKSGLHNQVRQWAKEGYLLMLIDFLLKLGFYIFMTSDHGNIEATGCGRPSEGSIADLRGERARIYSEESLRKKIKQQFQNAIEWPSWGLPKDYLPLLAPARSAFVLEREQIVTHGGISIEEVIVPLIYVS